MPQVKVKWESLSSLFAFRADSLSIKQLFGSVRL